jgi:amino-acid N-acetyltransferase
MELDKIARFYPRMAREEDFQPCQELLNQNNLPIEGVIQHFDNFIVLISNNTGSILGLIGLEKYEKIGLLRSLVIEEGFQGLGFGKEMVRVLETSARKIGVETLYLFTTSASKFFEKLDYTSIDKINPRLKESSEYRICKTAIIMEKQLKI